MSFLIKTNRTNGYNDEEDILINKEYVMFEFKAKSLCIKRHHYILVLLSTRKNLFCSNSKHIILH